MNATRLATGSREDPRSSYGSGVRSHLLLEALHGAAAGRFPPTDGGVTYVRPAIEGVEAIVAFTGHAFVMTGLGPDVFGGIVVDGFGLAHRPEAQLALARGGSLGTNDATLVWWNQRRGVEPTPNLRLTTEHDDHPRVRHAHSIRQDVRVFAGETGLITVSSGLAGRQEMSVEAWEPGMGGGRGMIRAAQQLADPTLPLFAAVAPGNARSLRAFLAEGFQVIASEVVVVPRA